MEINSSLSNINTAKYNPPVVQSNLSENNGVPVNYDQYVPGGKEHYTPSPKDAPKVFGAAGAAIGSNVGKATLPLGLGVAAGAIASSLFGPVGIAAFAAVGIAGGIIAEKKSHAGKYAGGMAGGAVGVMAGNAAEKINYTPSENLASATQNFSLKTLFAKLKDLNYTSSEPISPKEKEAVKQIIQPGDILITNEDSEFKFEFIEKAIGLSGNWVHGALVKDKNTIIEMVASGYREVPIDVSLNENEHIMVLKPQYKNPQEIEKTIQSAQQHVGKPYDSKMSLKSDDKLYCTELIYKSLKDGAPAIRIEPKSLFGFKAIAPDKIIESPDIQTAFSTGSSLLHNYLHKFA